MHRFLLLVTILGLFSKAHAFNLQNAEILISADSPNSEVVENNNPEQPKYQFWNIGSLLLPEDIVTPLGNFDIEPYIFTVKDYGFYDSNWHSKSIPSFYTFNPEFLMIYGLTSFMDILLIPQFSYKETQGVSSTKFNDFPVNLDFQLYPGDIEKPWIPTVLISIGEVFPTGKYRHLNPKKLDTDIGGEGTFSTNVSFVFASGFHLAEHMYLKVLLSPSYSYGVPTIVSGFNAYGGGFGTRGKIYPGSSYGNIVSLQLSFNQRWVFTLDIPTSFTNKVRFKGKKGFTEEHETAIVGRPSSSQISLAPALQYNWSYNFGLIAGSWFTVAGRNAENFASAIVAFNYYY